MSKAEKFIDDCTRNCSNEIWSPYPQISNDVRRIDGESAKEFSPWLTPDQARKAVEIAREEMMEDITIFLEGAHEYTDNKLLQMQYDNEGLICDFREFVRNNIMKDE